MKKSAMAPGALIALMCLAAASCSKGEPAAKDAVQEEAPAPVVKAGEEFAPTTNIRYIDLDSVLSAYTLAQEINNAGQSMMVQYQSLENQKASELQKLEAAITQKQQSNGYLSQASLDADLQDYQKRRNQAANVLGAQQNKIQRELAEQQQRLNDSINSFIVDYNASRHYDAILYKATGVYFNPALDITDEVIAGLNARYTASKAKEEKK